MTHLALAIDFGTSRTKVAWRDEQGNVLLLSFGENSYLPSLFYLPEDSDEILLGLDAISAYEDDVLNVVTNPKRMIERNASIRTTQARNTSTQDLLIELFRGSSRFRGVSSMCGFRVVHLWQDRTLQLIDFNEKQVSLVFLIGGTKNHI